jgi:iron complex transport system ATP-binding protein
VKFEVSDVVVRYRPHGPPALREVSAVIPVGSFYVLLGPNGSGKSTLLRALLGAVPLESGSATVEGRPTARWDRRELARAVGVVTQAETIAFPLSVRDLVAMGRYPHLGPFRAEGPADRNAIDSALEQCEVEDLVKREVSTLSGGEFQRVRIARALAQAPRALVLDEPTASLDLRHEMQILHLLRRSADAGLTILLVTHHLDLAARFADRVLLLDEGRVAAEGRTEDVFQEEILERVYRWRVAVRRDPITETPRVIPLAPDRS